MTHIDMLALITKAWPECLGVCIGILAKVRGSRQTSTKQIRRRLRRVLRRFEHVPPGRLEDALLDIAQSEYRGWRGVTRVFVEVLLVFIFHMSAAAILAYLPGASLLLTTGILLCIFMPVALLIGRAERRRAVLRLERELGAPVIA